MLTIDNAYVQMHVLTL